MSSFPSLRWRLRDATADAHARVDARVGDAFHDTAGYAAFLAGMHAFVRCARAVVGDVDDLAACEAALADDLQVLGVPPLDIDAVPAPGRDVARLGWRYVVAGSSLGARVLVRRAQVLGFDAGHGARYLALHARGDAWTSLLSTLDGLRPDPASEADACDGARAAFDCAERCFGATGALAA